MVIVGGSEEERERRRKWISHIRAEAGRKGAKVKREMIAAGVLLPGKMGGRKPVPTACPRCGKVVWAAKAAREHCPWDKQKRRSKAQIEADAAIQSYRKPRRGRPAKPTYCRTCGVLFLKKRAFDRHKCVPM